MRWFITGVILTVIAILAGTFQLFHLGRISIAADKPPGRIERLLANMAMNNYLDRYVPKQGNPLQPDAQNLSAGARLYEQNCGYCHGGLLQRTSPVAAKFNPPIPQLLNHIPGDPDSHLFWITKHGIRLSGMPTWSGILSDDQIWQVVAFLKHSASLPPEAQEAWRQAAAPNAATSQPAPSSKP